MYRWIRGGCGLKDTIVPICVYSRTSNKGPSEKGTTSIPTKDTSPCPFPIAFMHFNLRKEDNLSIKDKMAGPKVSFIWRFHCTCI